MGCFREIFCIFFREMGTFFQQNFCTFVMRWVLFLKKLSVFFVQGGYLFVGIFWCIFQKVGAIYAEFFCIFRQGGYHLKGFLLYLVSKRVVSQSLISLFPPLSVNTSLIVGNHL